MARLTESVASDFESPEMRRVHFDGSKITKLINSHDLLEISQDRWNMIDVIVGQIESGQTG